jgi:hypothetical protein
MHARRLPSQQRVLEKKRDRGDVSDLVPLQFYGPEADYGLRSAITASNCIPAPCTLDL